MAAWVRPVAPGQHVDGWGTEGLTHTGTRRGTGRGGGVGGEHPKTTPCDIQHNPRHTDHWAPRTLKRHQQEHRPQRPTESSDPTQHAKGRTGDCPGPRKETTTRRTVTRGGGGAMDTRHWSGRQPPEEGTPPGPPPPPLRPMGPSRDKQNTQKGTCGRATFGTQTCGSQTPGPPSSSNVSPTDPRRQWARAAAPGPRGGRRIGPPRIGSPVPHQQSDGRRGCVPMDGAEEERSG